MNLNELQINNIHYFIREELSTAEKDNLKYVRQTVRALADIPLIDSKTKRELLQFINDEWKKVTETKGTK